MLNCCVFADMWLQVGCGGRQLFRMANNNRSVAMYWWSNPLLFHKSAIEVGLLVRGDTSAILSIQISLQILEFQIPLFVSKVKP